MHRSILLALLAAPSIALAVPAQISHQGRLFDSVGVPLDGTHDITLSLYDVQTGGTAVWTDDWTAYDFVEGYYEVKLGSGAVLDPDALDVTELWLGIAVDAGTELNRQRVVSVPYALHSDTSTHVNGGVVNASEVQVGGTTVIDSSGGIDFSVMTNLPTGLDDGADDDTLAALACGADEVAVSDGSSWVCAASNAHDHDASQIATGTVDVARLPVGTSSTDVSAGDHTHSISDLTPGPITLVDTGGPCDGTTLGQLRFNASLGTPEFCDGTRWSAMAGADQPDVTVAGAVDLSQDALTPGRTLPDAVSWRVEAPADGADRVARFGGTDDLSVGLAAGDQALLINMQGALGDIADVGNYEMVTIASVAADEVVFTQPIGKSYDGSTAADQKVALQRVPTYRNLHVTSSGVLSASDWSGLTAAPYDTGILAFRATGSLIVESGGTIEATSSGFRGGQPSASGYCQYAYNGEGVDAPDRTLEGAANTGGGEGGDRDGSWCVTVTLGHSPKSGGGGSYGTAGTDGSNSSAAGGTYGDATLTGLFLGGAGGGSSSYRHSSGSGRGGRGGDGGGILFITAGSVVNSGWIGSTGADGENYVTHGGGGGGGAGGSVRIVTSTYVGNPVDVSGGTGGSGYAGGIGGDGGDGRVYVAE